MFVYGAGYLREEAIVTAGRWEDWAGDLPVAALDVPVDWADSVDDVPVGTVGS